MFFYRLTDLHVEFGADKNLGGQNVVYSRSGKKGDIYDLVSDNKENSNWLMFDFEECEVAQIAGDSNH